MTEKVASITMLLLAALLTPSSLRAEDLPAAASHFRDAATNTYNRVNALCTLETCGPEFSGPLASLGTSLPPLTAAIQGGVRTEILNAVANTNTPLQQLCAALGVDCQTPFGATSQTPPSNTFEGEIEPAGCAHCFDTSGRCQYDAWDYRVYSINTINTWLGCRKETPFCDYRDQPFTSSNWLTCLSGPLRSALLFPGGRDCRCPPGRPERQGGCPQFFGQSPGYLDPPPVCLQGDGQGCNGCCYQRCNGPGDGRPSCQGNNQWECDVCRFNARAEAAAESMRASAERRYVADMDNCIAMWRTCYDLCGDCYTCIIR